LSGRLASQIEKDPEGIIRVKRQLHEDRLPLRPGVLTRRSGIFLLLRTALDD
jgi:hypothetical protein